MLEVQAMLEVQVMEVGQMMLEVQAMEEVQAMQEVQVMEVGQVMLEVQVMQGITGQPGALPVGWRVLSGGEM